MVGTQGDNYDRFMCRQEEIRQSMRIIEQAMEQMADSGPINIEDARIVLPPKDEVYSTIEGTIQHFKIVMEGIKVPAGECYSYTEAGNGELGFYLVSDGSGTPYRVRIRPPCFAAVAGLKQLVEDMLVLARAEGPEQQAAIGKQAGGRVFLFLQTDDFARDHAAMLAAGVTFEEAPRHEAYGSVAVWRDPFGNRWDLIGPRR